MKIAWATDIHLDFLRNETDDSLVRSAFLEPLSSSGADCVVISGDVSLASMLEDHLKLFDEIVQRPVYFVLGNHDFYGSRFDTVRSKVGLICGASTNLRYLSLQKEALNLTPGLSLVGHDGWYDAYYGSPFTGGLVMSDWIQIQDFSEHVYHSIRGISVDAPNIISVAREASFLAAEHVYHLSSKAARKSKNVMIVTHVPPFPEVHSQGGKGSHDAAIPWYTSKLMGDAIARLALENPEVSFTVLCGHSHHKIRVKKGKNVECFVGGSEYGEPTFTMIEVK